MRKRIKQIILGVAACAALAAGGAALAGGATTGATSTSTTSSSGAPSAGAPRGFPAGEEPGTAAHENAEKSVTGQAAEKAQAAAVASVSGGKAGEVTTDFRGSGYEVSVTKSDGTQVTVHLDSSFKVQAHPGGPPRGASASGRPPYGQAAPNGSAPQAG